MSEIIDVAIVGGGISGLYSGWRMLTADLRRSRVLGELAQDGQLNVQIFEMSNRVGGRLLSLTPPEMPDFKAEFGGMRYLSNQRLVRNLVDKLDLPVRPFPVGSDENIYYLRGQHLREKEFTDPAKVPYRLSWLEKGKTPSKLIVDAIDIIVPGATRLSPVEWQEMKENYKFNGEYLYNLGFWNVLHQVMSSEAYKLLLDAGGYITSLSNWNAAEALSWYLSDFGPEAEYMTINKGMEALPLALAQKFEAAGGQIHLCRPVASFDRQTAATPIQLNFADGTSVQARHLILAMPRRALELISHNTPYMHLPELKELVPTVTPHPMFKLFLCYRYPWWRDAGVNSGRSITDLPLRQIYYFGSEPDPGHYEAEIMDSLLMASYDDGAFAGFWAGLAEQKLPAFDCTQQNVEGQRWLHYIAPPEMVAHAQSQLKLVHDLEYIPAPYAAGYIYWGLDPYGGAWNSWNIRVKAWEVQERILQPRDDWNVYVCGEAYSGSQGWTQGALETAENLLDEKFDLQTPGWLTLS
jgi:monoamine oxidase